MSRKHSWQTVAAPFIAYTLIMSMHLPLSYGMVCKITVYDPETIALDTVKNSYNHIMANPLVWETVIHLPEAQNKDFSYLIAPTTGADYMSPKLEKEINLFLKSRGCKWGICQGYGLTEVASGISVNILQESNKPGSVGIPFINTKVSIFDVDSGVELLYGEVGEVCISGPTVMLGYYKNKNATDEMIRTHTDGTVWLHSGDLGRMDEDGFLFIEGRIKRMFVQYNGAKVFPPIIEKVIMQNDAVEKCCVIGMNDPVHTVGKIPVANIVLQEKFRGQEKDVEEKLKFLCFQKLPDYAQPVEWTFMDSFPVTSIGKVDYRALEQMAQSSEINGR